MLYDAAEKQVTITLLKLNGQSCSASAECQSGICCSGSCAASCEPPPSGGGNVGTFSVQPSKAINLTKNETIQPPVPPLLLPNVTENITPPENKTEEIPQEKPREKGNGQTFGLNVFFGTLTVVATVGWVVSVLKLRKAVKKRR